MEFISVYLLFFLVMIALGSTVTCLIFVYLVTFFGDMQRY